MLAQIREATNAPFQRFSFSQAETKFFASLMAAKLKKIDTFQTPLWLAMAAKTGVLVSRIRAEMNV